MDYQVSFGDNAPFVYAKVTGQNRPDVVPAYMREIMAECRRRDCFKVLIEECLDGPRLEADDVFEIASAGAMEALGVFQAIAYVDERMGDMAFFMEDVAVNRGMPIKVFPTVSHAKEWLDVQVEGTGEQEIFRRDE